MMSPMCFQGSRELKDFLRFLKRETSHSLVLSGFRDELWCPHNPFTHQWGRTTLVSMTTAWRRAWLLTWDPRHHIRTATASSPIPSWSLKHTTTDAIVSCSIIYLLIYLFICFCLRDFVHQRTRNKQDASFLLCFWTIKFFNQFKRLGQRFVFTHSCFKGFTLIRSPVIPSAIRHRGYQSISIQIYSSGALYCKSPYNNTEKTQKREGVCLPVQQWYAE